MGNVGVGLTGIEIVKSQEWEVIKSACLTLRGHQVHDGSVPEKSVHKICSIAVAGISGALRELANRIEHDRDYLLSCAQDFDDWSIGGFQVPDFYESLSTFHPELKRIDGTPHLVVFPMYTQNG